MFSSLVTIFNQYEHSDGTTVWYAHIIPNVHLETDRAQIIRKYGAESTDNAELHISYSGSGDSKTIADSAGTELPYLPPKEWKAQVNDSLAASITLAPGDFFWWGEWDGDEIINDDDYTDRRQEGFYAYMNTAKDYVYLITSVGTYNVIPHFELLGK